MEQFREFQLPKIAKKNIVELIALIFWKNKMKTLSFRHASWNKLKYIINMILSIKWDACGKKTWKKWKDSFKKPLH